MRCKYRKYYFKRKEILRSEVGGRRSVLIGDSDFRLPTSDFRPQTSDFRLQASDLQHQTSLPIPHIINHIAYLCNQRLGSIIKLRTFVILSIKKHVFGLTLIFEFNVIMW